MTILDHNEAAPALKAKNGRAVIKMIRADPTLPFAKKGKRYLTVDADLEEWVRRQYPDAAKRLLTEEPCIAENPEATGTSASAELDRVLEQRTGKGRGSSNTSSTRRRGTGATA